MNFFKFCMLIGAVVLNTVLIAQEALMVGSCSGKSGTSTLVASFRTIGIESWHVHSVFPDMVPILPNHADHVILIDSFRDIISRKIASYFENITHWLKMSPQEILSLYQEQGISIFLEKLDEMIVPIEQYYGAESWMLYGYNYLEDADFLTAERYQIKQIGNLYFVNLRYEDIQDWETIIRSIGLPINLSGFRIIPANIGSQKWYAEIYRDFLAHFTLSQVDFDAILQKNKQEIIHFEGYQGIENFIRKWESYIRHEEAL